MEGRLLSLMVTQLSKSEGKINRIKTSLLNRQSNQAGFTLVEVLLIFFIIVIMLMSLPPLFHSVQNTINEKYFLQQYEEDLFYAQSLALSRRRAVYYQYDSKKKIYKITDHRGNVYLQRQVPDDVVISHGHLANFRFVGDGNINRFGNVWVQVNGKKYQIFISIGSGRFEIFEESS